MILLNKAIYEVSSPVYSQVYYIAYTKTPPIWNHISVSVRNHLYNKLYGLCYSLRHDPVITRLNE